MTGVSIKLQTRTSGVAATWSDGVDALGELFVDGSAPLSGEADGWLVGALPTALRLGGGLTAAAPVDGALPLNLMRAGGLLHSWYPRLAAPNVRADARGASKQAAGVGCFFSGGVDSFYSALKNRDRITHLIFVHGFDIDVDNVELGDLARAAVREAALGLGLPLIELSTNVRHVTDRFVDWGTEGHGAALGLVGHLLAPTLGRVIIPASYHVGALFPWGSHPDLDPLWSSSAVEFEHDGHEATRPEKVAFIADHPAAMEHLRVCWLNPDNAYNCGRCEKCLRTVINLQAVGAGGRCKTLPSSLPTGALEGLRLSRGGQVFARENLDAMAARRVADPALEKALRRAIRVGRLRDAPRAALRAVRSIRPTR